MREREKITNTEYQDINKTTKKSATRDLQDLVKRDIFIQKGITGKGVYYTTNPAYKGDIRGHNEKTSSKVQGNDNFVSRNPAAGATHKHTYEPTFSMAGRI